MLGFAIRRYLAPQHGEAETRALTVTYSAIFVLTSLILGFTFSFTAARFETRRLLVVDEANAIGTTYVQSYALPTIVMGRFRAALRDYAQARLATYSLWSDRLSSAPAERHSLALQDNLLSMTAAATRDDPMNVEIGLLRQAVSAMIDASGKEAAAWRGRVPLPMFGLVLVVSLISTLLVGVNFVRLRGLELFLALVAAMLFATVVTTVDDLDRPQFGFVRVSLGPLQAQLQQMRKLTGASALRYSVALCAFCAAR